MFFPSPGIFEVERFSGTDGKALKPEELKKVATCRVSRRRVVGRGLLKDGSNGSICHLDQFLVI